MFGTPAFFTASTMRSDSAALRPRGFSQSTIFPASAAAMAISACVSLGDRKSTRLNSSHLVISYAVFSLKKSQPDLQMLDGDDSEAHSRCRKRTKHK